MISLNPFTSKRIVTVLSSFNKKIEVVEFLGQKRLVVDGLLQSGGLVEAIWKKGVAKLKQIKFKPKKVLILGLGGGTAASLVFKNFPQAEITGIEIDKEMVKLGFEYLGMKEVRNLKVLLGNGLSLIKKLKPKDYDLVLVDMYKGKNIPEQIKNKSFLQTLQKLGCKDSVFVFNLLFYGQEREKSEKFIMQLDKIFPKVELIRTWSNLLVFGFKN